MGNIKWTFEMLYTEALKYSTRGAFYKGSTNAYCAAKRRGILDKICLHMNALSTNWTFDALHIEALKYETRSAFAYGSPNAYNVALRRNILDQICGHMKSLHMTWTLEMLKGEALRFATRKSFAEGSPNAYSAAHKRGVLDNICNHMTHLLTYWTLEMLHVEALKFKTRTEFYEGSSSAYATALNRGVLDEICNHMVWVSSGYNSSKPGDFYVVRLDNKIESFIGFGISNDIDRRLREHARNAASKGFTMVVLSITHYEDGKIPQNIERKLKKHLHTANTNIEGFKTEAIAVSDYPKLLKFLDKPPQPEV